MPCREAMIKRSEVACVKADQTVEDILLRMEDLNLRALPVVTEEDVLVGMFSTRALLKHLLPASVTMQDGLRRLDFVVGSSPSISERLSAIKHKTVHDVMDPNPVVVHPDMSMWEVIRELVEHGNPLPVVDQASGKLVGLVSDQSTIELMNKAVQGEAVGE